MKILNIGSLNIDKTYTVDHFVNPGETITALKLEQFQGGKGLNQSVSLGCANANVYHLGAVGKDGDFLLGILKKSGVNIDYIKKLDSESGHAIIQIDKTGQNNIILSPGTNRMLKPEWIENALENFEEGDFILLQNETNCLKEAMEIANDKKIKIAFNPSPMDERILSLPLEYVDLFFINEIEGALLSGKKKQDEILEELHKKYPKAAIVLTLGKNGSYFYNGTEKYFMPCFPSVVVDTTGAGDTFTGYFLSNYVNSVPTKECLKIATMASSIQISKKGAATAIPDYKTVLNAL